MKYIVIKILQIFATIYAYFYFSGFALPIIKGHYTDDIFENISVLTMCLFFCCALIVSWFKVKIGGILFVLWFVGIFVLSSFFWTDAGMVFVLSIPMLLVGIILFILGYKNKKVKNSTQNISKFEHKKSQVNVVRISLICVQ